MLYLLLAVVLVVLALGAAQAYKKTDPQFWQRNGRRITGAVAVALSIALMMAGRLLLAIPLALYGYYLLGHFNLRIDWGGASQRGGGNRSSIRTGMLEMTLDHDTGTMDGTVRSGRFTGRRLSALTTGELQALLEDARAGDPQAAQLLEAYIARMHPGTSYASSAGNGEWRSRGGMTVAEAFDVLGLKPGASREDIQHAHRTLMKKIHPDRGGSTYLASKINEAKDVLLSQ